MELTRRRFLVLAGAAATAACDDSEAPSAPDASATDVPEATDLPVAQDVPPNEDLPPADDVPALEDVTDAGAEDVADAGAEDVRAVDATMMLPELGSVFPFGAMAGDMDASSAVLWTRYTGRAALGLRVERMEGGRPVETAVERELTPGPDGFTHVTVEGLRAGARYRAVFTTRDGGRDTGRSRPVRFRAALAGDSLEPVVFGATSCTKALFRPFAPLQRIGEHGELDFFVHLGDMVYCDGARSIGDFREKYAENYASDGFRKMFESAGLYTTWDDHEVDNNWNPESTSATTVANARRAYFEHRAQRRHPTEPDRIWRSAKWGDTLEVFILDCRGERRPSTRTSRSAQYLSRAQMDWLKEGLARSTARFKVIVNSVPIANFPFTLGAGEDRWEGYDAARDEVLDHITSRNVRGVWWLSGDFHFACIGKLETSGPRSAMRDILVGPGGQLPNPLYLTTIPPQFDYTTGENNYAILRADPARNELTVRYINGAGRVIFERAFANP